MSQRVTDEEFRQSIETAQRVRGSRGALEVAVEEAHRSRASEEAKDATIKALADALDSHGNACRVTLRHERPDCHCIGCVGTRALRLAGRI